MVVITYCAVDVYALVSGFVGYSESEVLEIHKQTGHYFKLWLLAAFYSVGITIVFYFIPNCSVGFGQLIKSAFPVTFNQYWYFSAYTGLFFIRPYLNLLLNRLEDSRTRSLLICCFIVLSCYGGIVGKYKDPFTIGGGSSFLWISYLYCVGAYIKKTDFEKTLDRQRIIKVFLLILGILLCESILIPELTNVLFGRRYGRGLLLSYSSPFVLLLAVSLVMLFSQISVNTKFRKVVLVVSKTTFGIYLIHDHPLIRKYLINGTLANIALSNHNMAFIYVVITSCATFLVCCMIESSRSLLSNFFHVKIIEDKVEKLFESILTHITFIATRLRIK